MKPVNHLLPVRKKTPCDRSFSLPDKALRLYICGAAEVNIYFNILRRIGVMAGRVGL